MTKYWSRTHKRKKPGPRNVWFKLVVGLGAALGLLLLVQSLAMYFRVSKDLVSAELQREAHSRVATLEREFRRLAVQAPKAIDQTIEEMRQEEPGKIAWIRVMDMSGRPVAQCGTPAGPVFTSQQVLSTKSHGSPISTVSNIPAGRVMVYLYSVHVDRRPEAREPASEIVAGGLRFVEIALYWNSAAQDFGRLRARMLVSSFAALGLVGAMLVLWLRFPRYVRAMQLQEQAEIARSVQADLLLAPDSAFQSLDFAASCVPAWQVGGDFYDVYAAGKGCVALAIGDVSGDGLPASVIAGVLVGAVRASSWLAGRTEHEESSKQLNDLLHMRTSLDRFASLFWSCYEPSGKVLRYINAGHPPPILLRPGSSRVARLEEGGPVLGVVPGAEYRQGITPICPGDLLVLFSDGVTEAPNVLEEEFGEDRLIALIRDSSQKSAAEIRDEILEHVRTFIGEKEVQDDLTLVVVRFSPQPQAPALACLTHFS